MVKILKNVNPRKKENEDDEVLGYAIGYHEGHRDGLANADIVINNRIFEHFFYNRHEILTFKEMMYDILDEIHKTKTLKEKNKVVSFYREEYMDETDREFDGRITEMTLGEMIEYKKYKSGE